MKPKNMIKPKKKYESKVKILDVNFADMKVGQRMAIGTPASLLNSGLV